MFTNLIESDADLSAFKRRSSFFLATVTGYALILFAAGIAGILANDARVEAQTSSLELLEWMPPMAPVTPDRPQPPRRTPSNTNRVSPQPTRPILYESASNPTKPPETVSADPNPIPPAPPGAIEKPYVSDPPSSSASSGCENCTGTNTQPAPVAETPATTPLPTPAKPKTQSLPSVVLVSKAISLPQPPYPTIAKQMGAQGPVNVQILVDETGRVISAHVLSGHATLVTAAKEAALRARFTPTLLNDKPVKVQGVIIYNFVLR